MKLIVGLGNPGKQYVNTRHNVGFQLIAELVKRHATSSVKKKFHAEVWDGAIAGESVLLLAPQTFMNLSGQAVQAARDFYKVELTDTLVVCDDFAIPLGKLRMRSNGSAGGQNGLKDIIQRSGSDAIPRLRIGIGPLPPAWDAAGFVLGKFSSAEEEDIAKLIPQAADGVALWVQAGITQAMNQVNR
jgi:PTH1 family peptidyl-tRNA hydrolase